MKTVLAFFAALVLCSSAQELKKTLLSGEDCLNVQKAAKGDEVTVHYEGRLQSNGFKFDSSFDRGEPIKFVLGTNQVVQGWERGLVGTCPGQSIKLEIPSNLGYGQTGAGDVIPPNADLVFEIKLEAIKSKEVKIDVFEPVVGCPEDEITRDNDVIRFNYIGYFEDGQKYDSTLDEGREPLEVTIGKVGLKGWDDALKGACPGEKRLVFIPYELAYGEDGVEGTVPPKANLVMQIEFLKVRNRVLNFLDRISGGSFNSGK